MSTPSLLLKSCRPQLLAVMLFSGIANILQLTTSLYMMQVFDRVLTGRSFDTLIYLTIIALVALTVLAVLEAVRARVMERVGAWLVDCH